MLLVATGTAWLASVGLALGFVTLVLVGTRHAMRRRRHNVDPLAWVIVGCIAGGSTSVLTLALI